MRAALDEVMTRIPAEQATATFKVHMAEFILKAAAQVRRIRALFKQAAAEKIELDLNEVIGEVLHLLKGETARRRVAVETDLGQGLAPVAGGKKLPAALHTKSNSKRSGSTRRTRSRASTRR